MGLIGRDPARSSWPSLSCYLSDLCYLVGRLKPVLYFYCVCKVSFRIEDLDFEYDAFLPSFTYYVRGLAKI
jgi:hypothetical protein